MPWLSTDGRQKLSSLLRAQAVKRGVPAAVIAQASLCSFRTSSPRAHIGDVSQRTLRGSRGRDLRDRVAPFGTERSLTLPTAKAGGFSDLRRDLLDSTAP
jgi:hypothetical protein